MDRVNPFENLDDFSTKKSEPITNENLLIDRISEENNFPSRQPLRKDSVSIKQQRRYRTGRNQQINIKATEQTINKLYHLADIENVPLGELLERALNLYEKSSK